MEIKLKFSEKEINHLWHTKCKSFVHEQPSRFTLLETKKTVKDLQKFEASIMFCESFIEAKIIAEFYKAKKKIAIVMTEETSRDWLVWVNIPFNSKL